MLEANRKTALVYLMLSASSLEPQIPDIPNTWVLLGDYSNEDATYFNMRRLYRAPVGSIFSIAGGSGMYYTTLKMNAIDMCEGTDGYVVDGQFTIYGDCDIIGRTVTE